MIEFLWLRLKGGCRIEYIYRIDEVDKSFDVQEKPCCSENAPAVAVISDAFPSDGGKLRKLSSDSIYSLRHHPNSGRRRDPPTASSTHHQTELFYR
ncbi:hypothetical protein OUZ56_001256 [Daphnia magna]|uniref:Uncharacterized protein n=1 Tax=Daphnia magna TaxID=35525 RepID=A0ABR0A264_9CRUS|nr:hypothetical protein OUZ56_001256 [Daphnia magna]